MPKTIKAFAAETLNQLRKLIQNLQNLNQERVAIIAFPTHGQIATIAPANADARNYLPGV